jgi:hypothetical protein
MGGKYEKCPVSRLQIPVNNSNGVLETSTSAAVQSHTPEKSTEMAMALQLLADI